VVFAITREGSHETWVHSLGLARFGKPELELFLNDPGCSGIAGEYLLEVATYLLTGNEVGVGELLGERSMRFQVRPGTRRKQNWGGVSALELQAIGSGGERLEYADAAFATKMGKM
jgi:hypothetical protein